MTSPASPMNGAAHEGLAAALQAAGVMPSRSRVRQWEQLDATLAQRGLSTHGQPIERIERLLDTCAPAPTSPSSEGWQLPEGLDGFARSGDELLTLADREVPSVIAGVAGECDVLLLAGEEKKGMKTWLALDLAVATVVGGEWLGFQVQDCRPAHVLVLSPETHVSVGARRLRALCVGRGIDPADALPFIHVSGERISAVPYDEIEATWRTAKLRAQVDAAKIHDPARRMQLAEGSEAIADAAQARLGAGVGDSSS